MDDFDPNIRYRGSLQNYLIDTGNEVILADAGFPAARRRLLSILWSCYDQSLFVLERWEYEESFISW